MKLTLKKSVTLLELLIAIVLLSIVTIGLSSIDLFSRGHVLNSQRRTTLQNEASLALEHMTKQITRAIGNTQIDPAVIRYNNNDRGIMVRIDDHPLPSGNGRIDSDDSWVAYRQEPPAITEIRYYTNAGNGQNPRGSFEVIATNVVVRDSSGFPGLRFIGNFNANQLQDNFIEVLITCRWLPDQPASVDNPEVQLHARIKMPSVSTN